LHGRRPCPNIPERHEGNPASIRTACKRRANNRLSGMIIVMAI